jgi:hypothetical protein
MDSWVIGCGIGHGSQIGGSGIIIPSARTFSYENETATANENRNARIFFIFYPLKFFLVLVEGTI